jgi:diguanylate cyclase (GGDEF)-like protein
VLSSQRQKHLAEKVRTDLVARSLQGTWAQPVSMVLLLATSTVGDRAPGVAWAAVGALALLSAVRYALLKQKNFPDSASVARWHKRHTLLAMACAALWGMVPAYAICAFGRFDKDTMLATLIHSGIVVGTMTLVVHDVRLIRTALALLVVPEIVAQMVTGGQGWNLILIYFQFLLYMSITGSKLNKAYWRQISDNHDLAMLALHDNLTGLPNRRGIGDVLNRSIAEAQERGRQIAMFYVDFDGFKQINDVHSHRVGDLFLCEVAQRLSRCVEKRGVVARLGGDEFTAVITEGVSAETAREIASDVLRIAREPLVIEGAELACTVSIGVSLYPDDAKDADHLLRVADQAMYVAKTSGKNKVCFPDAIGGPGRDLQTLANVFCQ